MPIYTYRREDGTTFDIRQGFSETPLERDPNTGQKVHRVIHASGIIFKGSGFYVTDNRGASRPPTTAANGNGSENGHANGNGNGSGSENGHANGNGNGSAPAVEAKTESTTASSSIAAD